MTMLFLGASTSAEWTFQHSWPAPIWVAIALAILCAVLFALLYRHEPLPKSGGVRFLLPLLRIAAACLLVWMMFGWLQQRHRTEPADLIIALDDSASMAFSEDNWDTAAKSKLTRLNNDSAASKLSRFGIVQRLLSSRGANWLEELNQQYTVKVVLIGDSVRELTDDAAADIGQLSATRPSSRLGSNILSLLDAQRGRPTAAIVLLTDGIATEGSTIADAADVARQRGVPLYVLGIGSEKPVRDAMLSDLFADDMAFVDDVVTVTSQLHAVGLSGQALTARLLRTDTGQVLASQPVTTPADSDRLTIRLTFRPQQAGEYPLRIEIDAAPGEADLENNHLTHHLAVLDSTIRVLLVQGYPSYEFRYLRNLLSRATKPSDASEKAFALTTILQEADAQVVRDDPNAVAVFPLEAEELFEYDVVILGDADPALMGTSANINLARFATERGGGVVLIAGPRYMPLNYRGSALTQLFPFDLTTASTPTEAITTDSFALQLAREGALLPACQLVPNPEENARLWRSLPGWYWSVDLPDPKPAARVLAEHPTRLRPDGQKLPLILLQYVGAGKVLFHASDESYRWARYDGSDEFYSRYWIQMIHYLARSKLMANRSPAEIIVERQQVVFGDSVPVRVRFLQPGVAPQSPQPVMVVLEGKEGAKQEVELRADPEQPAVFGGTISGLAAGEYRLWLGSPGLEKPPAARTFTVSPPAQESTPQPMQAKELERAAKLSRGRYYTIRNADRLLDDLPRGQRLRIESLPARPIWNAPPVAAVFIALLTLEWILRRRAGLL